MSNKHQASLDVHWYLYSDREARDRHRITMMLAAPAFMLLGFGFLIGWSINLIIMPISAEAILGLILGITLPPTMIIQLSEMLVRTDDLRSDEKGIYVQKGLSHQQTLIPYEVIEFSKHKSRRKYTSLKYQPYESFTIIPVRGVRDFMRSLVGFEYGFGFRPVIIVSQFHENSDRLLRQMNTQ